MQIDSVPRYPNVNPSMTIPSPSAMDFDSDPIIPEFPSTFMDHSKFHGSNYSPIITDSNRNLNLHHVDHDEEDEDDDLVPRRRIHFDSIQWSQMSFTYSQNHIKLTGHIELPMNFHYTPIPPSSPPFQYQPPPVAMNFCWSPLNEQLMQKLFKLEGFFENKVVLELGCGFGIPSIVSLMMGAKHVYVTDGNADFTAILPAVMEKNKIARDQYTIKKVLYNDFSDLNGICKKIDIVLACDVLDTQGTALNFYETISFYFERYKARQKRRFMRRKHKELRDEAQTNRPNIHYQFNTICGATRYGVEDVNFPITNGGYLPCSLRPKLKKKKKKNEVTDMLSILSRSDDDNSTNSTHNMNTELPNTTTNSSMWTSNTNHIQYEYKAPYVHAGVTSLSAMRTVLNAKPLPITHAKPLNVDGRSACHLPKLKDVICDDDDDDGDSAMMNDDDAVAPIDEAELAQYMSKCAVNAPILILALNPGRGHQKDVKLKDDPFNTFYTKCVEKGYRIQNVVYEWNCQIWIVKA